MPKYKAKVKVVFTGDVEIIADNQLEAKEIAEGDFWALLGTVGADEDVISDWDFCTHADSVKVLTVKKLKNER